MSHTFMYEDDLLSCLTCGAVFQDDPENGASASNGDNASRCTGDTSMIHGDRHETGHELDCANGCQHCQHDCNCLLCTG